MSKPFKLSSICFLSTLQTLTIFLSVEYFRDRKKTNWSGRNERKIFLFFSIIFAKRTAKWIKQQKTRQTKLCSSLPLATTMYFSIPDLQQFHDYNGISYTVFKCNFLLISLVKLTSTMTNLLLKSFHIHFIVF